MTIQETEQYSKARLIPRRRFLQLLAIGTGGVLVSACGAPSPSQPPQVEREALTLAEAEKPKEPPSGRRELLVLEEEARPILSLEDNGTEVNTLDLPVNIAPETVIQKSYLVVAGLNEVYAQRVIYNLPAYREAGRQTGIDWKVLAAFNGVETNFRSDILSGYGKYGPLQVVGANYILGTQLSFKQFVYHLTQEAVPVMKQKAQAVGVAFPPDNLGDWAKIAYAYNGMPKARAGPDGRTYYGGSGDYWYRSGYVVNNWTNSEGKTYKDMYVLGWGGGWTATPMDRDGFLALWTKLYRAEKLAISTSEESFGHLGGV